MRHNAFATTGQGIMGRSQSVARIRVRRHVRTRSDVLRRMRSRQGCRQACQRSALQPPLPLRSNKARRLAALAKDFRIGSPSSGLPAPSISRTFWATRCTDGCPLHLARADLFLFPRASRFQGKFLSASRIRSLICDHTLLSNSSPPCRSPATGWHGGLRISAVTEVFGLPR